MDKDYLIEFKEDLKLFHDATKKFYKKEITVAEYKGISGGFGSYAQRGGEKSMLRLRLCGGEINIENLEFIAKSMKKHQIELAHSTTCQTIQLHNLTEKCVCELVEEAFEHGIITRGGGGDYPRNVMCSPLTGLVDEAFDVLPYAKQAADYLLQFINKVKLPRKLKVCFSNGEQNETHATMRDMGFVASSENTFDVYICGGIGIKPKMGVLVAQNIPKEECLYYIKAMIDIFVKYGNYENRGASRSRFLQDTLGIEELKKRFLEAVEVNKREEDLNVFPKEDIIDKKGEGEIINERIHPQKQKGLYTLEYHPVGGVLSAVFFEKLYHELKHMDEVKIRLAPDQGMYFVNLTANEAEKILNVTSDAALTDFEKSTACIGANICQVGIGTSQELLDACVKAVKLERFTDKVLPKIKISGCPSSCGVHQIGMLGFRGGMKPDCEKKMHRAFAVFDGGCEEFGKEKFGEDLGVMFERDIPQFFVELGKAISERNMVYTEYRKNCDDEFKDIVKRYI